MGWSCSGDAGRTMERWTAACRAQTGQSNVFRVSDKDGDRSYFWEDDGREHNDGRVTGQVFLMLGDGRAREVARFTIRADGSTTDGTPGWLRKAGRPDNSVPARHARACARTLDAMPDPIARVFR